jgi:hypothetical protein
VVVISLIANYGVRFLEKTAGAESIREAHPLGCCATVEKSPSEFIREHEIRHFQFVVVLVDDSRPDDVPRASAGSLSAAFATTTALVVACLGVPLLDNDSVEARIRLLNTLAAERRMDSSRTRAVQRQGREFWLQAAFFLRSCGPGLFRDIEQLLKLPEQQNCISLCNR